MEKPLLEKAALDDTGDASDNTNRWAFTPSTANDRETPTASGLPPSCPWASQFPLKTSGRHIVNNRGERFRLKGINWYGASDVLHVVGGLDTQSLDVICQTIYNLGFNVVRLPFSNEMMRGKIPKNAIHYGKNPRLKNLNCLQVYDEVVRCLGKHKIAVIINNHTTYGEFCGPPSKNSLWFDDVPPDGTFLEDTWLDDWITMARRYSACPQVIGYDLRNEIRPRWGKKPIWNPKNFGDEAGACNWTRAATNCIRTLLQDSQYSIQGLMIVERIVWPQKPLSDYAKWYVDVVHTVPELENRLVLGAHMYHWSGPDRFIPRWSQPRCTGCCFVFFRCCGIVSKRNYGDMQDKQLRAQIDKEVTSVLEAAECPVPIWISEFGADIANKGEMEWFKKFTKIVADRGIDWAYWPLNVGNKPGCDANEAYGMLADDWTAKQGGDERLSLMEQIGLVPPEKPYTVRPERLDTLKASLPSSMSMNMLFNEKDPLAGFKSWKDFGRLLKGGSSPTHNPLGDKVKSAPILGGGKRPPETPMPLKGQHESCPVFSLDPKLKSQHESTPVVTF